MTKRYLFLLGLLVTLVATALEVARGRAENYRVYSDATALFWQGLSPYTDDFVAQHGRYFLYPPPFCVLFAPVLLLPQCVGAFVWNVAGYTLFASAIHKLPERYDPYKNRIFLFLLPVLLQSVFCYQYNVAVALLFLFAYTLMERSRSLWAAVLIALSAATKVFGAVQLPLLLAYRRPWRAVAVALATLTACLLLPAMRGQLHLYADMLTIQAQHQAAVDYVGLLYAPGLKPLLLPNMRAVQLTTLAALAAIFFLRRKAWGNFQFRATALAVLMGYVVLLSDCPETHTYLIALAGYQLAFWLMPTRTRADWALFWLLLVCFGVLPTDVLCPPAVHQWVHGTLCLDVFAYTVAWLRMVYIAARKIKA